MSPINDSDTFIANRSNTSYQIQAQDFMSKLQDTDLMLVNRGGVSYKATGDEIKEYLTPPVDINEPTILAPPDGAGIGGDITYMPKTSATTNVDTLSGGWTAAPPAESTTWKGITYGDGKFVAVASAGTNRVMYSTDGLSWTSASAANPNDWHCITYGNGKFVALATSGVRRAMYSTNGINWTEATLPQDNTWVSVTYGELADGTKRFVGISTGGTNSVIYSDNGINWTNGVQTENANWKSVTFGNGKFVAVSANASNRVMYSTNGINWTGASAPAISWSSVTYGEGKFVAVASAGTNRVMYSTDAISWTAANAAVDNQWTSVTYGDGYFVAVAQSSQANNGVGRVMYSSDGISWTQSTGPGVDGWTSVIYGGDKFVAVSQSGTSRVMWSYTGGADRTLLNFVNANSYNADTGADMGQPISETFTAGQLVNGVKAGSETAVGTLTADASGNTMTVTPSTSPNFKLASTVPASTYLESVAYNNGTYVAVGSGTTRAIYSTDNARTWAIGTPSSNANWKSVAYGDNKFVAVAQSGSTTASVMYSADGISWTGATAATADPWMSVAYGDNKFVAVAQGRTMTSPDGINWTPYPAAGASNINWNSVTYGDNKWVAVGGDNNVMYSTDAANWTLVSGAGAASQAWVSVTYGNGKFVAVTSSGTSMLMYSTDGITWTINQTIEQISWQSVTYGAGNFVAVSEDGVNQVIYSADCISWTQLPPPASSKWRSITYGAGQFVAVAQNGTNPVMYSPAFGGTFVDGMEVINNTTATKTAPDADDLVFVGSIPASTPTDGVLDWGNSTWEVATDSAFTSPMFGTKIITSNVNQTLAPAERGAIVLAGGTDYWARLKYTSNDPLVISPTSDAVHFKTAEIVVNLDEVFSVDVYSGQNTPQTIDTGINYLEDALIWIKNTSQNSTSHGLYDKQRDNYLNKVTTDDTTGESPVTDGITPANGNVTIKGGDLDINYSGYDYVSFSFKASPKFFDVVKYTGNADLNQIVPHGLSSIPGCIIVKNLNDAVNWNVYHQGAGVNEYGWLDAKDGFQSAVSGSDCWTPTANSFTAYGDLISPSNNNNGKDYIAYFFADTPELIKCGAGSGIGAVDVGFEPAFVLFKTKGGSNDWQLINNKNFNPTTNYPNGIRPNNANKADTTTIEFTSNGFDNSLSADPFIYVAIAKGGSTLFFDNEAFKAITDQEVIDRFGVDPYTANLKPFGIQRLMEEPTGVTAGYALCEGTDTLCSITDLTNVNASLENTITTAQDTIAEVQARVAKIRSQFGLPVTAELPQAINGFFPLYTSEVESDLVSDNSESHSHDINGVTYYMPDTGVTLYHGNYDDSSSGGGY